MNSYALWPMDSNSLNCYSIQTVYSFELKFGMYIIGNRPTYCVEFGEFRIDSFFYRSTKKCVCVCVTKVLWQVYSSRTNA